MKNKFKISMLVFVVTFVLTMIFASIMKYSYNPPTYPINDPIKQLIYEASENIQKAKELHEKFPDDKIYLANYIKLIMANNRKKDFSLDEMVELVKYASEKDSENAFYNYYLAHLYFQQSTKYLEQKTRPTTYYKTQEEIEEDIRAGKFEKFGDEAFCDIAITDQEKFDLFLAEYFKGLEKPYYRTYSSDFAIQVGKSKLKSIDNINHAIQKLTIDAGVLLPHLNGLRSIARAAVFQANISYLNGDIDEAKRIFESSREFTTQINENSYCLIEVLVTIAIQAIYSESARNFYHQIGDNAKAEEHTKLSLAVRQVKYDHIREKNYKYDQDKNFSKHAGHLSGMLIPAIGTKLIYSTLEKMHYFDRMFWYKFSEKLIIATSNFLSFIIVAVFLFFMSIVAKVQLRKEENLFWDLPKKKLIKLILVTFILPIIIFFVIANIPILNNRTYNISYNMSQFFGQNLLMGATATIGAIFATIYLINSKFKKLFSWNYLFCGLIYGTLILISCITLPILTKVLNKDLYEDLIDKPKLVLGATILLTLILVLMFIITIFLPFIISLFLGNRGKKIKLFVIYLLPFFMIYNFLTLIILFSVTVIQEKYYFGKNDIVNKDLNKSGLSVVESKVTQNSVQALKDIL